MWSQALIDNREKYIAKIEQIKTLPKANELFLHLGCGNIKIPNWTNIDKYVKDPDIVNQDIYSLDYADNSVDGIYSSHSLEHLPIRHARLALKNWFRILKNKGKLFLAIPDLELTMQMILDKNVSFAHRYFWFMHVLFGYQVNSNLRDPKLDSPVDLGQFHTCGFTEELIRFYLLEDGYTILDLYHYDGWSTPSIFIEAEKNV